MKTILTICPVGTLTEYYLKQEHSSNYEISYKNPNEEEKVILGIKFKRPTKPPIRKFNALVKKIIKHNIKFTTINSYHENSKN
jgi:hypothetical protein